jgi:DNA uptake protein ComE-like DNA-binding protein
MTNLNTASIDDLLALEGIGTQRAAAILKLRDEIGYITYREVEANFTEYSLNPSQITRRRKDLF